jgi:hypothetical protein
MINFRRKVVLPVFHRREARSFEVVVYGCQTADLDRVELTARVVDRGFSNDDWIIDWQGARSEYVGYEFLSLGGRRPMYHRYA